MAVTTKQRITIIAAVLLALLAATSKPARAVDCTQAPNPTQCAMQQRNAGVIDDLVAQDPNYWNGMAGINASRREAEQERATLERIQAATPPLSGPTLSQIERQTKALERSAAASERGARAATLNALSSQRAATAAESAARHTTR